MSIHVSRHDSCFPCAKQFRTSSPLFMEGFEDRIQHSLLLHRSLPSHYQGAPMPPLFTLSLTLCLSLSLANCHAKSKLVVLFPVVDLHRTHTKQKGPHTDPHMLNHDKKDAHSVSYAVSVPYPTGHPSTDPCHAVLHAYLCGEQEVHPQVHALLQVRRHDAVGVDAPTQAALH